MNINANNSLADQLLCECNAMARHAFGSGLVIPQTVITLLNTCKLNKLTNKDTQKPVDASTVAFPSIIALHTALSRLVSPAKPRTLLLILEQSQKKRWWSFLGPVPIIRSLILMTGIFLVAWIGFSLSPKVTGEINWAGGQGVGLLLDELFIFFAAGIGATFSILFQVNRFVVRGIYDPIYDASYWTRVVLGIVSGVILAMLIPLDQTGPLKELTKPTLALLGGFSVTVVYRILTRLIAAVESLVKGDTQTIIEANQLTVKAELEASQTEERSKLAAGLMSIKNQLATGTDTATINKNIDSQMSQLIPQGIPEQQ
ncbi:hypothetical protein KAR48_05340 [bacterium]|nr:hypothetical protein [bacterium]